MDKLIDIKGRRFGMLLVKRRAETRFDGQTMWWCVCDCGVEKSIRSATLRSGKSRSCGCQSNAGHNRTHGMTETATYKSWCHMKERCDVKTCKSYPRYGGRGIKYDPRWGAFENFLSDMGEKPAGRYSLDRIDNDGDYTKANCRWATDHQQANNNDHPRLITYLGVTRSVTDWAKAAGLNRLTLSDRLRRGWPIEKAITQKARQ